MPRATYLGLLLLLAASTLAAAASVEEEDFTPADYEVAAEPEDDSGYDVTVADLDRSLLPRLSFKGEGYLRKVGRKLGAKLRRMHRTMLSAKLRARVHVKNMLKICRAVKSSCHKVIAKACVPKKLTQPVRTAAKKAGLPLGCRKTKVRGCRNHPTKGRVCDIEVEKVTCEAKARCYIKHANMAQRALAAKYYRMYSRYMKVAGQVYKGRFRAFGRKYIRLVKKSRRLWKSYKKLRREYLALRRGYSLAKKDHTKKSKLLSKQRSLIGRLRLVGSRLRKMLKECRNKGAAAEAARKKLQNAFNALLNKYKGALANHKRLQGRLQAAANKWKAKAAAVAAKAAAAKAVAAKAANAANAAKRVARAKAAAAAAAAKRLRDACPYKDACGVCKGDERTCARRRSALQCHAVGDPHFRTFDGLAFNYQNDGQFILARHDRPYRFEVQNHQWGQCQPGNNNRCNKGWAVMGDGHVVVSYAKWFTQRRNAGLVLINGAQRSLPYRKWVHLGGGALRIFYANTRVIQVYYCWDKKFCDTRVQINHGGPWRGASWQDIYILGRWQWSSGRSMSGLCGNYDSNAGNDRGFVFPRIAKFRVTNQDRSFFKNPRFRKVMEAETAEDIVVSDDPGFEASKMDDGAEDRFDGDADKAEDAGDDDDEPMMTEEEKDEEAKEGIRDPKQPLTPPGADDFPDEKSDMAPEMPLPVEGKEELKKIFKTEAMRKAVEAKCKGLEATEKRDCMFDVAAGMPAQQTRAMDRVEMLVDKEKKLKKCLGITKEEQLVVQNNRLPSPEPSEGYTVAFWLMLAKADEEKTLSIMSKDNMLDVSVKGQSLTFKAGEAECTAENPVALGEWGQYTLTVEKTGSFQVYYNGEESCSAKAEKRQQNSEPLVVGKKGMPPAIARLSQLYYAPIHISENMNKMRYAVRRPPKDCRAGV
eukprot:CAMPEP_0117028904 /NCGR_PEP_ID=MMETSP0472-20121206/20978_1 /TAXON_ID=693140 ORGANISM="Tiarina fusus, Strain LIS" /NCGR_SAMPLE_ID=MMETSP0472 /ASSEMBLY_ACC=CAM_ASM_000603 /LENGTH=927 /DNA_ID=CAMNT_0004736527 /DNA_START=30 /DNA_END=2813 /DNA_ORIENTATION=+